MRFSTLISAVSTAALAIGGTHAANVFKVRDITSNQLTARFGAGFTDLGIPVRTPDNRLLFVCGDTFNDRVGGPDWRSPIGLYSNNDINNVVINGAVGGGYARGMVPEGHAGGTTAIPSDVFAVGNKLYMHLQRGVIYKMDHSDFWVSEDNGNNWRFLNIWQADQLHYDFQQKTFAVGDDGFVYVLSTIFNRDIVSDLLLHRIPIGQIETPSAWQPWGFRNGAWGWGNPATTIARPRKWGEICFRKVGNKWIFTWLNMEQLSIRAMVLNGPTDNFYTAAEQILILPSSPGFEVANLVASPYGGFIFPGGSPGSFDIAVSQWAGENYHVMQYRVQGLA